MSSARETWKILNIHHLWKVLNIPALHFKPVLKIKAFSISPMVLISWQDHGLCSSIRQYLPLFLGCWTPKLKAWKTYSIIQQRQQHWTAKPAALRHISSCNIAQVISKIHQKPSSFPLELEKQNSLWWWKILGERMKDHFIGRNSG